MFKKNAQFAAIKTHVLSVAFNIIAGMLFAPGQMLEVPDAHKLLALWKATLTCYTVFLALAKLAQKLYLRGWRNTRSEEFAASKAAILVFLAFSYEQCFLSLKLGPSLLSRVGCRLLNQHPGMNPLCSRHFGYPRLSNICVAKHFSDLVSSYSAGGNKDKQCMA